MDAETDCELSDVTSCKVTLSRIARFGATGMVGKTPLEMVGKTFPNRGPIWYAKT